MINQKFSSLYQNIKKEQNNNNKDKTKTNKYYSNILNIIKHDLSQHVIKFKLDASKELQKFL